MPDKKQIEFGISVSERAWSHVSQKAIGDIYDVLVELITNSDDSYRRLYSAGKIATNGGDIAVEIHRRHEPKKSLVVVKDKAEGMTFADMRRKLERIGDRTAGAESRGFMARGLRDCCALGDVLVESLADDKYHACQLPWRSLKLRMKADGDKITDDIRKRLGIGKGKSGTVITLECQPGVRIPWVKTAIRDLSTHYALRDIIAGKATKIGIRDGSGSKKLMPVTPLRLEGERVVDTALKLDDYPKAKPRLQIWRSAVRLDGDDPRMRRSGILIADGWAVHQCTLANYEREPLAHHYHGRLDCDYIRHLLEENDECWNQGLDFPKENPRLLIDNNRQTGLDSRHPFTEALFAKINEHLGRLVEQDRKNTGGSKDDISDKETRARLDKLAQAANKFLKEQTGEEELAPNEETAIDATLKAGEYILPPRFTIGVGQTKSLHLYVRQDRYNPGRKTKVQTTNEKIVALEETFAHRRLQPHHADETIFWGALKVRGVAIGKAEIIVRPSEKTSIKALATVVQKRGEDDIDFAAPLEFERKKYSVKEGKKKKLKIFAELPLKGDDAMANVFCESDAVVVKQGGHCRLIPRVGTNYAEGEIEIEGRSITPRAVEVVARLGRLSAKTLVRVVEPKYVGGGLRFKPVDDDLGGMRARWADLEGDPNLLKISAIHPSTKKYFGEPPDFPGQSTLACRALMAEIITEHVCLLILRREMRGPRRGSFQFPVDDPVATLNQISGILQKKAAEFSKVAHKILGGDL